MQNPGRRITPTAIPHSSRKRSNRLDGTRSAQQRRPACVIAGDPHPRGQRHSGRGADVPARRGYPDAQDSVGQYRDWPSAEDAASARLLEAAVSRCESCRPLRATADSDESTGDVRAGGRIRAFRFRAQSGSPDPAAATEGEQPTGVHEHPAGPALLVARISGRRRTQTRFARTPGHVTSSPLVDRAPRSARFE
jgi:hypothetical protein